MTTIKNETRITRYRGWNVMVCKATCRHRHGTEHGYLFTVSRPAQWLAPWRQVWQDHALRSTPAESLSLARRYMLSQGA